MSRQQIVTMLVFFQFMANSGAMWMPDSGWSIKRTFSVIANFYLTKTEYRTRLKNL